MALERADIGVLRGGARAHRTLAQIDFLERRPRARRVVVEQRALRDRLPDGALDVAGAQFVAALDVLVEPLQHAAGLLAGAARAVDGDVIAALLRHHAEPAFDQREVLSVLPEQDGSEPVVLEGEHGLRGCRLFRGGGGRDRGIRCAQVGSLSSCCGEDWRAALLRERAEQSVGADLGDGHRHQRPISARGAITCTACKYGVRPTSCPGSLPGFSSSTSTVRPANCALKARHWRVIRACSRCRRSAFSPRRNLVLHRGGRRARARRIHERIGAGEADLVHQRQRVAEILFRSRPESRR